MATVENSSIIGVENLVYAKLTSENPLTYDTVKPIAPVTDIKITPKINTDILYADNTAITSFSNLAEIDVELDLTDVPLQVQADLLGHQFDTTKGVINYNSKDIAPYVAIGFKSMKSNGKYRYVWLLKGKFQDIEESYSTMQDKVKFANPALKGTFYARYTDHLWKYSADEDEGYTGGDSGWFTTVYKPTV